MRFKGKKRKRRSYVRKSRATPKTGFSSQELAQLSGVQLRTIRSYLQRGVLPRSRFKGTATRYSRSQLLWLLAIRRLRSSERLELSAIHARLSPLSPQELEAFATADLGAGKLADALGVRAVNAPTSPSPASAGPRWVRIELALGLELHVRDDASAHVHALSRQLRDLSAAVTMSQA